MKSNMMVILIGGIILVIGGLAILIAGSKKKSFNDDSSFAEEKWNKMIDLWVNGKLDNSIKDVLTYDAEINNGGHLQFFENCNDELEEMMISLKESLPKEIYNNLNEAYDIYLKQGYNIENVSDYVEVANQDIYSKYDKFYYENDNMVNEVLKEYASTIEINDK